MPPSYVKAYVKRSKNDAADAAAICEAVTRPSMRFVPIKSAEQQSALMLHRTRDLLIRQRTQLINAMRAHLAELGLVAQTGREGVQQLMRTVENTDDKALPSDARFTCQAIIAQLQAVQMQIAWLEKRIHQVHRANPASKRLESSAHPHNLPVGELCGVSIGVDARTGRGYKTPVSPTLATSNRLPPPNSSRDRLFRQHRPQAEVPTSIRALSSVALTIRLPSALNAALFTNPVWRWIHQRSVREIDISCCVSDARHVTMLR
jgi:hypothetical protein